MSVDIRLMDPAAPDPPGPSWTSWYNEQLGRRRRHLFTAAVRRLVDRRRHGR